MANPLQGRGTLAVLALAAAAVVGVLFGALNWDANRVAPDPARAPAPAVPSSTPQAPAASPSAPSAPQASAPPAPAPQQGGTASAPQTTAPATAPQAGGTASAPAVAPNAAGPASQPAPEPTRQAEAVPSSQTPAPARPSDTTATPASPAPSATPPAPPVVAALPPAPPASPPAREQPAPSFDLVRVEPTGDAVIAGRGAPGATVEMLRDGQVHARAVADGSGLFAFVPPPLPPGSHQITLQAIAPDGTRQRSRDSVTVAISEGRNTPPLVALTAPDKPTVILSNPEPPGQRTAQGPAGASQPGAPATPAPQQQASLPPANQPAPRRPEVRIASVEAEEGGRLYVSGEAAPGATVRLYLNDTMIAPGGVGSDGKVSFAIGRGVRPGDYRVRIDDVDPVSGSVKSRAEVAFNVPPGIEVPLPPQVSSATMPPQVPLPPPAPRAAPQDAPAQAAAARKPADAPPAPSASPAQSASPAPNAAPAPAAPGSPQVAAAPAEPARPTPPAAPSTPAPSAQASAPPSPAPGPQASLPSSPMPSPQGGTPSSPAPAAPGPAAGSGSGPSAAAVPAAPSQPPASPAEPSRRSAGSPPELRDLPPGTIVIPDLNTAIVSRGDNLWRISRRIYGQGVRYTVIYGANQPQIRNPNLIYPGQVFVLPPDQEPQVQQ